MEQTESKIRARGVVGACPSDAARRWGSSDRVFSFQVYRHTSYHYPRPDLPLTTVVDATPVPVLQSACVRTSVTMSSSKSTPRRRSASSSSPPTAVKPPQRNPADSSSTYLAKRTPPPLQNLQPPPVPRKVGKSNGQKPRTRAAGRNHGQRHHVSTRTTAHRSHGLRDGSRQNPERRTRDVTVPSPVPPPTPALFQKLPKERYSAARAVRCGVLSQLFQQPPQSSLAVSSPPQFHPVPPLPSFPKLPTEKSPGEIEPHVSQQEAVEGSDSDDDSSDPNNAILISKSLAYMKLAEIARISEPMRQRRHRPLPPASTEQSHDLSDVSCYTYPSLNIAEPPVEALPQSPKTVRRGFMERELSPSWRRMILHQRSLGRPPSHTVAPPKSPFVVSRQTTAPAGPIVTVDPVPAQVNVNQDADREWTAMIRRHFWRDDFHHRGW